MFIFNLWMMYKNFTDCESCDAPPIYKRVKNFYLKGNKRVANGKGIELFATTWV